VVVSLFAGAARVGPSIFALGTAIGMAPGLIGMTIFGSQLGNALGGNGRFDVWAVAGAVGLIAAFSLVLRRFASRRQARAPGGQQARAPLHV
jgi:phospholipase D1/2